MDNQKLQGLQEKIKLMPLDLRNRPAWYKEKVYPANGLVPLTELCRQEPNPEKIVQLSEFQQELAELISVLNGDIQLKDFKEKVIKHMNVREGIDYMENVVNRFFEVGYSAAKLGVSGEHIVEMRLRLLPDPNPQLLRRIITLNQ